MIGLLIDSTRERLVVIGVVNDNKYYKVVREGNKRHMPLLMPTIEEVLRKIDTSIENVSYISSVIGPGSFTGIRIGVACVNAFALALNKPLVSVNSFELMAYNVTKPSILLIEAGHNAYYGAKIDKPFGSLYDYGYYTEEDLENINIDKIYQQKEYDYINEFVRVAKSKAVISDTQEVLRPLYLRKSQAEREASNGNSKIK